MKKNLLFVFLVLGLAACQQNQESQVIDQEDQDAGKGDSITGVVILNNLGFATQVDNEKQEIKKWGNALRLMDVVEYLGDAGEYTWNNRKAPYVQIRLKSGEEGYANKNYIILNAQAAVVITERSTFYVQPDLASPESRYLVKGDLLAVLYEGAANNFVKVAYANPVNSVLVTNRYLKADTISTTSEDVNSMVMYFLATRASNKVTREELLKNAMDFNSNFFSPLIQTELQITLANFNQEVLVKENQFQIIFNDTVAYNMPFETATVIQIFNTGDKVVAKRKLEKQNEVWYEIVEPACFIKAANLEPFSQPSP
jgi:hypothetical protein